MATIKTRWMLLCLSFIVSFLVYMYNVIRFPLFNNDFDPWVHYAIVDEMMGANQFDGNAYLGFPGLHVLVIYVTKMLDVDPFLVIKWFPVFTGALSSIVVVAFIRFIIKHRFTTTVGNRVTSEDGENIVAFGCILNTTLSLFSVVSSGMFWGQMLTASLVPIIMIKFVELNQHDDNRLIIEFLLVTTTMFLVHHLTSFLLVTFLSFAQLYLLLKQKASIKGTLVTFIAVLIFLLRYEALSLNLSIVSSLTWGKTNFFYLYFIALALTFVGAFLLRKLKPVLASRLPRAPKLGMIKRLGSNIVLMSLAGVLLGIVFLAYIYPYILSFFTGLSPTWFLYYGSNLILLAPLAIAGVVIFGRMLNKGAMKVVVYCWVMTIIFVLVLLFALYFLKLGVGALEFGRLSTFIYPMLSILAAFSVLVLTDRRSVPSKDAGNPTRSKVYKILKHAKPIIRVAVLAGFCILMPVAVIGITPPPSATLTRYWNTPSEQTAVEWMTNASRNDTTMVNVDYHLLEITSYYVAKEDKVTVPASNAYLYFLDEPQNYAKLAHKRNYLVLIDDVMLDTSLSYSSANAEHGVLPPLGRGHLATYDAQPFLNKIYCTGSQWLYQCHLD